MSFCRSVVDKEAARSRASERIRAVRSVLRSPPSKRTRHWPARLASAGGITTRTPVIGFTRPGHNPGRRAARSPTCGASPPEGWELGRRRHVETFSRGLARSCFLPAALLSRQTLDVVRHSLDLVKLRRSGRSRRLICSRSCRSGALLTRSGARLRAARAAGNRLLGRIIDVGYLEPCARSRRASLSRRRRFRSSEQGGIFDLDQDGAPASTRAHGSPHPAERPAGSAPSMFSYESELRVLAPSSRSISSSRRISPSRSARSISSSRRAAGRNVPRLRHPRAPARTISTFAAAFAALRRSAARLTFLARLEDDAPGPTSQSTFVC